MQTLERSEEFVRVRLVEACTIVLHVKGSPVSVVFLTELDVSVLPLCCVLPGVPEQMPEGNRNKEAVAGGDESIFDLNGDPTQWIFSLQLSDDVTRQLCEIYRLLPKYAAAYARPVQKIIDDGGHLLCPGP